MMKSNIFLIATLLAGSMAFTACEDFLDQKNTTDLNQGTFFESDEAVEAAVYPLYNYVWWAFNEKAYYAFGDGRSNNITAQYSEYIKYYGNLNETSLTEGLDGAWNALYSVVAQSNNAINNIRNFSTGNVSETVKTQCIAEARFMRGTAYWYIASLWGMAIIYENTNDLTGNYVVQPHQQTDAFEFAIRDLEYAAKYLPTVASAKGRVNKYSAYGMLSRMYLSMAGVTTDGAYNGSNIATDFNRGTRNTYYLDLAKKAALKVITESTYDLMEEYGDLFTYENNNCKEALFQLQWLTGTNESIGGCNQPLGTFMGWSSMVSDGGTNWGGAMYCSWDLWCEYEAEDTKRRHATVASYGEYYPELNVKGGGYTYGVTEARATQGANIKKYVIGTIDDNGVSYKQSNGLNTHMLRLPEVYLNLAEAILGNNASTQDETALYYFNRIRTRAKLKGLSAITYEDIRHERRIEFALEGLYWFDLLRRSYYRQQEVINYMNSQNRNASYDYNETTGVYELSEDYVAPGKGVATATARSLTLPVSDSDQNKNHYLKPDVNGNVETVVYGFGEREVSVDELYK